MDCKNNEDYKNLHKFWDSAFCLSEGTVLEVKKSVTPDMDLLELAPSQKLYDAAFELAKKDNILDYGTGSGWASLIMARAGANNITAVDVSDNAIKLVKLYSELLGLDQKIKTITIDSNWLEKEEEKYDGVFTSNVLDVIPLDMAKDIIKNLARVLKKDGEMVAGFNYYMNMDRTPVSPRERIVGNAIYIDNVLRLVSLTDREWEDIFSEYFFVSKIDHFAWPGEAKESRRLFFLRKK